MLTDKTEKNFDLKDSINSFFFRLRLCFSDFLQIFRKSWILMSLLMAFLVFSFSFSPLASLLISNNNIPAISQEIYSLNYPTDYLPMGLAFLKTKIGDYYYRYDDFSNSGVSQLQTDYPSIETFKTYSTNSSSGITYLNPISNENEKISLVCTQINGGDDFNEKILYPGISLINGTPSFYPGVNEIYVSRSFADEWISDLNLPAGDYSDILSETLIISITKTFNTTNNLTFFVSGVFDETDPLFSKVNKVYGQFFLIRSEISLVASPTVLFEVPGDSQTLNDYLSTFNIVFPPSGFRQECHISFLEYKNSKYVSSDGLNYFMDGLYSSDSYVYLLTFLLLGCCLEIAFISIYVLFLYKLCKKSLVVSNRIYSSHLFAIFILSFFVSVVFFTILKTIPAIGSYSVPIFTLTNSIAYVCVFCLDILVTFIVIKVTKAKTSN
jgi:hypothetical protein